MSLQPGEYAVTPQLARVHAQVLVLGGALQVAMFHQVTDGSPGGKMDCHSSSQCASTREFETVRWAVPHEASRMDLRRSAQGRPGKNPRNTSSASGVGRRCRPGCFRCLWSRRPIYHRVQAVFVGGPISSFTPRRREAHGRTGA